MWPASHRSAALSDDVTTLRALLTDVTEGARTLPWARQRPWRPETHVGYEGEIPTLDLHDLNVRWGLAAVAVLDDAELSCGEVRVITGRGRHTGGVSKLRQAVSGKLVAVAERRGWRVYPEGPGALRVVIDPTRVARRPPSLMVVFFVVALTAGLYATWAPLAVLPPLAALVLWWRQ